MLKKLKHFIQTEIWSHDLSSKSRRKGWLIRQVRIYILAFKGFFEDRVAVRASSLTYFTMLSIIPVFVLGLVIAQSFGFEDRMNAFIEHSFQGQDQVGNWVNELVTTALDKSTGRLVTGIGVIVLFWSIVQVLNNIELSFNDIWQVKKARTPMRKFTDYLAMMIIAPFAIAIAGSFTVKLQATAEEIGLLKDVIQLFMKLIPYFSIWLVFTLAYVVMPNTKVKFKYALIAGVFAGTLAVMVQWLFIKFQLGVTRFDVVFGSFAAIMLTLLLVQITWLIVLMGAEIAFAYQNIENYEFEEEALQLNHDNKRILTVLIAHHIVKNFEDGGKAKTADDLSHALGIPLRLLNQLIYDLVECRILAELATDDSKDRSYQPAMDINKLNIDTLYTRLERMGGDHLIVTESEKLDKIMKIHEHLLNSMTESPSNVLLKDI
jgi:membrane protein